MLELLIALVIFGAALYLLELIPMDATIRRVIQVIAIVLIVIWALRLILPMAGVH